jgi:tetratricopeptide (TPR) repeat protein
VAALLHDEAGARQQLGLALVAGSTDNDVMQVRWDVSSAAGKWAPALETAKALVAQEEARKSAAPGPEFAAPVELVLATQYRPLLAYAEAMTGDTASATALISQTPTDCYLCVRTRAKVAAAAGDAATADHWFAEAVRQGPDLPMAYFEWGETLLARGDLAGAAREFSLAHAKGPHFADPLKAWGDVLIKQHHPKEALAKYDEALHDAPDWDALKVARAAAARRT